MNKEALLSLLDRRNVIASTTVDTLRVIRVFSETTVRVCKLNKLSDVLDIISYYASKKTFAECKYISNDVADQLEIIVEYAREKGIVANTTESNIPKEEEPKEDINQTNTIETYNAEEDNIKKTLGFVFEKYVSYRLTQTNGIYKIKFKTFTFYACIVPVKHEIIDKIFYSNKVYVPLLKKETTESIGANPILLLGLDFNNRVMFAWDDKYVRPFIFGGTSKALYVSSQMIVSGQSSSSVEKITGRNGETVYAFRSTLLPEYLLSLRKNDEKLLNPTNDKTDLDSKKDKDNATIDKEEKTIVKPTGEELWDEFYNVWHLDRFIKTKAYRLRNKSLLDKLQPILSKMLLDLAGNQEARNRFISYNSYDDYPILLSGYLLENELLLRGNADFSMKYFAGLLFDYLAFVKRSYEEAKNKPVNNDKSNKPTSKLTPVATTNKPKLKQVTTKYTNGKIYIKFPGGLATTPSDPIDALYAVVSLGEPKRIIKLNIDIGKKQLITNNPIPLKINKYRKFPEGFFMDTEYSVSEIYDIILTINSCLGLGLIVRLVK